MFSRTMSHLSLTVVAAAVLLVSGCVPPDNSAEQVQAINPAHIQEVSNEAARKAVEEIKPVEIVTEAVTEAFSAKDDKAEAAKALREIMVEETVAAVTKALSGNEGKALRKSIRQSVCRLPVSITLRDFSPQFMEKVRGKLKDLESSKDKRVRVPEPEAIYSDDLKRVYQYAYTDLRKNEYERIKEAIKALANDATIGKVSLAEGGEFEKCDPVVAERSNFGYGSVSAKADSDVDISLTFRLRSLNLGSEVYVWMRPGENHWLWELKHYLEIAEKTLRTRGEEEIGYGKKRIAKGEDLIEQGKKAIKKGKEHIEEAKELVLQARAIEGDRARAKGEDLIEQGNEAIEQGKQLSNEGNQLDTEGKQKTSKAGMIQGKIKKLTKQFRLMFDKRIPLQSSVWTGGPIEVSIPQDMVEKVKASLERPENLPVYVMVAAKPKVAGIELKVVQYREFIVDSFKGIFNDRQLDLADSTLQPACPPAEIDETTRTVFRDLLEKGMGWKPPCKEEKISP